MSGSGWGLALWGSAWGAYSTPSICYEAISDIDYRKLLKAQIVRNKSNSSIPDMISMLFNSLGIEGHVIELATAVAVELKDKPTDFDIDVITEMLPIAAGVGLTYISYSDGDYGFGFDSSPNTGFGGLPSTYVHGYVGLAWSA